MRSQTRTCPRSAQELAAWPWHTAAPLQTAVHWWWCKGHVRVYNCAGMWPLQQIFYRIPLILLPQHNISQSPAEQCSISHLCVCHRVLPGAWRVFSDFRFQSEALQHPSIGPLQHCSMHPSSLCTFQPVCGCSVPVLWPDDTQHRHAEYRD